MFKYKIFYLILFFYFTTISCNSVIIVIYVKDCKQGCKKFVNYLNLNKKCDSKVIKVSFKKVYKQQPKILFCKPQHVVFVKLKKQEMKKL